MTRIVGGAARGRRLAVPPTGTRPTSDRAREGLFNTLRSELELRDALVLDLYAGTGAIGLESLSRGAARAVFVENDRQAVQVLVDNIRHLGFSPAQASVHRCTVESFLAAPGAEGPFELVFADPPYELPREEITTVLQGLVESGMLAIDGVVVIERSSRDPEPGWPQQITMIKQRRYGAGCLWYGRRES